MRFLDAQEVDRPRQRRAGIWAGLGLFLPFALLVAALHAWMVHNERQALETEAARSAAVAAELAHQRLTASIAPALDDIDYLSALPIVRDLGRDAAQREAAEQTLRPFVRSKPRYVQLAYLEPSGMEVLRLERSEGRVRVVDTARLNDRAGRPYVQAVQALPAGRTHLSPIRLAREEGSVRRPLRPVVRLVQASEDAPHGVVVLQMAAQPMLDAIAAVAASTVGEVWLIDDQGHWVRAPQPHMAWSAMREERADLSFASRHPEAWRAIRSSQTGERGLQVPGHFLHPRAVTPDELAAPLPETDGARAGSRQRPRWHIVAAVPQAWVQSQLARRRRAIDLGALLTLLVGAVAAAWVGRSLVRRAADRRAIADRERLFRGLMAGAPDGFLLVRASDGRIAMANQAAAELFGHTTEQLHGMAVEALVPPSLRGNHAQHRQAFGLTSEPRRMGGDRILHAQRRDGSAFACSIMLNGLEYQRERWVLCAVRDVSLEERTQQMKELNAALAQANAALEASVREMDAFNHSVAHDLRAPLRAISGFSAALTEDFTDALPADAETYLRRIRSAANRMGEMIDGLLALPRVSRGTLSRSEVDVSGLAREVLGGLRELEPERTVATTVQDGLTAWADRRLLTVVIQNLLGNAWKFTRHTPDARIEVGCTQSEDEKTFFVRDNGVGFDARYVDKLFKPFQRLHKGEEFEGNGIGLATTQAIVTKHGGRIWASANPGEGSEFRFSLHRREDT